MTRTLIDPTVEEFRKLEQQILDYALAGEHQANIDLLDEKFQAITFHGQTHDRTSFAETLFRSTVYYSAELGDINVVLEGTIAVVTGLADLNWERSGMRVNGPVRFTKIWVKRADGWRILSVHVSDARLNEAWTNMKNKNRA